MIKNRLKYYFYSFFHALGVVSFIYIIMNVIYPKIFTINFLWAASFNVFCVSISALFIFYSQAKTLKGVWIKRFLFTVCCGISTPLSFILFKFAEFKSGSKYILYICLCIVLVLIFNVIGYILADRMQKKELETINNKLKDIR